MSFGLPIVSTDNTGAVEILEGGVYGELATKDATAIWHRLEPLLHSTEMRRVLSSKSLARAKDFATGPIMAKWQQLIE